MSQSTVTQPVISSVDIQTENPITSVQIICERTAISAYVTSEDTEPVRYMVLSDATVKVAEIVIDPSDPRRVTVNTY